MSKKLIGARSIGDTDYIKDQVITDEEFEASGLEASDVIDTGEVATAKVEAETPAAPADADAVVDAQAPTDEQKNEQEQSAPVAEATGDQGGASADESTTGETVEHTLTEQDFVDHPELADAGHKVGDVVNVPKPASTEEAPAA